MGLERMAAILQGKRTVFETDAFARCIGLIEEVSGIAYYAEDMLKARPFRIIADHMRAATFVIGDPRGVVPSNVGQGYIVRRLLRRAIREAKRLGIGEGFVRRMGERIIEEYGAAYPELRTNQERIVQALEQEEQKFSKTLEKGLREFEKLLAKGAIGGAEAFLLFSSYGFPLELTEELLRERGLAADRALFQEEFRKHQELSRASAGTFKGGLADDSVASTRLHTATHLLHQALRTVLGSHVAQKGSNITPERLRFDFSHPQKLTPEELSQVEAWVNAAIAKDVPMTCDVMTVEEAKVAGAIGLFEDTYAQMGGKIKVYTAGDLSKEVCGGPHVAHTGELGSFKILKEEAVSAGVRRIKASVTGG
jgi:alanyl-tRNA synthetase